MASANEQRRRELDAQQVVVQPDVSYEVLPRPFVGKVTQCNSTTGKGKVKRTNGNMPTPTVATGAVEITVWLGKGSFTRINDYVLCVPSGGKPAWWALQMINMGSWEEPCVAGTPGCTEENELAAEQDDPDETTDCDDEIS